MVNKRPIHSAVSFMPFRFGPMELIIFLVVVLIIFGVGRLPEIGGAMGKAIKEFRTTQKNELDSSDEENEVNGSRKS